MRLCNHVFRVTTSLKVKQVTTMSCKESKEAWAAGAAKAKEEGLDWVGSLERDRLIACMPESEKRRRRFATSEKA